MTLSNRDALDLTVATLEVPEAALALLTLTRTLADAVDGNPGRASLAKEYRATLVALVEACRNDDVDDEGASLLALVRTPLGDAEDIG